MVKVTSLILKMARASCAFASPPPWAPKSPEKISSTSDLKIFGDNFGDNCYMFSV